MPWEADRIPKDRRLDIVAMGEPMVELVRTSAPGIGTCYRPGFGGDTSNAIVAAARQGARTGYVTALGEDEFGDGLMTLWAGEGVDSSAVIRRRDAPTGIYLVLPHESERDFIYYRQHSAASLYVPGEVPDCYIAGASVLHVSAISQAISDTARDSVWRAMSVARNAGALVSYDTNLRLKLWPLDTARPEIHASMAETDIALPSVDDSRLLTGHGDPDAIVDFYLGLGPSLVALKLGAKGALVATAQRRERIPPIEVAAVDSTGAGDAFDGSFLAYLVETGDPFVAAKRAVGVAGRTVAGYGAIDPIPRRRDIVAAGEAG